MRSVSSRIVVARPRAAVFAFHADAANLGRVLPGGLVSVEGESRLAAARTVAIRIGPWRSALTVRRFDPPRRFTDAQRPGPFHVWEHDHRFVDLGGATLVTDTVSFALRGPLGALEPLVALGVRALLRAKLARTRAALEVAASRPAEASLTAD